MHVMRGVAEPLSLTMAQRREDLRLHSTFLIRTSIAREADHGRAQYCAKVGSQDHLHRPLHASHDVLGAGLPSLSEKPEP
jgi:hypothetical protein